MLVLAAKLHVPFVIGLVRLYNTITELRIVPAAKRKHAYLEIASGIGRRHGDSVAAHRDGSTTDGEDGRKSNRGERDDAEHCVYGWRGWLGRERVG